MPTHLSRPRTALIAAALTTLLLGSSAQAAIKTPGDLRVVNAAGKTLAEHTQYTDTNRIRTSPDADCFGDGTEGSGEKVTVPGPTALGIVGHAMLRERRLRPLEITDAFSFGLGLCGIGGNVAPQTGYWYLKINRAGSLSGGDSTPVGRGDDVLWYLIEDFNEPMPMELVLKAPAKVKRGEKIPVEVVQYADDGSKSPAAGARIKGTGETTDDRGMALVDPSGPISELQARRGGDIPSNVVDVCRPAKAVQCTNGHSADIRGTNKREIVRTTRGPALIRTYGGDDKVNIRNARDSALQTVVCGRGDDIVLARADQAYRVARNCERVKEV